MRTIVKINKEPFKQDVARKYPRLHLIAEITGVIVMNELCYRNRYPVAKRPPAFAHWNNSNGHDLWDAMFG